MRSAIGMEGSARLYDARRLRRSLSWRVPGNARKNSRKRCLKVPYFPALRRTLHGMHIMRLLMRLLLAACSVGAGSSFTVGGPTIGVRKIPLASAERRITMDAAFDAFYSSPVPAAVDVGLLDYGPMVPLASIALGACVLYLGRPQKWLLDVAVSQYVYAAFMTSLVMVERLSAGQNAGTVLAGLSTMLGVSEPGLVFACFGAAYALGYCAGRLNLRSR